MTLRRTLCAGARPARAAVVACLGAVLAATACRAAPVPDYVRDTVGEWLIVTDEGKPGCRIRLAPERTIGGYVATPAPDCAGRLPAVGGVTAWDYDGGVRLRDATRRLVLDFQEDETTIMKTTFEKPPVAFLVKARPGVERAPYAPALLGTWILRRPTGPALCEVVLAKAPPAGKGGEEELVLRTGTPCDPAIARLRLNRWAVEDVRLILYGEPETSLAFEASGPETYAKAETGKPLDLVRAR